MERAAAEWAEAECPDRFAARIDTAGGAAYVFIYHHETVPMGGRLFTGDVRNGALRRPMSQNGSHVATL